jgi:hypothetical protein
MRRMFAAALLFAQPFGLAGSTGGTGPVSPSVLFTEMSRVDAAGRGTLELLVLWRGTPGWFRKGSGGASGRGGGSAGSVMGGGGPTPMIRSEWISQGGANLSVRFDPAAHKAWIQDKEIELGDANVILVDGVDSSLGPQVVRMLRIDPDYETRVELLPAGPSGRVRTRPIVVPAQTFIRRSPELIEFLRCDVAAYAMSRYEQQMFDMWCTLLKQP